MTYLASPAQWDKLAARLRDPATWPLGLDSETFGQPDRTSPQHRARVQCWSLGVYTANRHPRGYRMAQGVVLPREALEHAGLRGLLEDPGVPKMAHNAPHDFHALVNEGVQVAGLEDTLQWARVALPCLPFGYGLKDLEVHVLGKPARPGFKEVVSLSYQEVRVRRKVEKGCICGKTPCRAKATSDWWDEEQGWWRQHTRVTWRLFTPERREAVRQRDVSEMVPGCPGWETWVAYSLADAVGVLELADYLMTRPPKWGEEVYPWSPAS